MFKRTNKPAMETIIVQYNASQTAFPTGALVGSTNSLNLVDGSISAVSADHSSSVRAYGRHIQDTDTATTVRRIKIVQGTPKSSAINTVSPFGEGHKSVVESQVIDGTMVRSVATKLPNLGYRNAIYFDGFTAPSDEVNYGISLIVRGVRSNRVYGYNNNRVFASIDTPDYTTLGYTSTQATTDLLAKLAAELLHSSAAFSRNGQPVPRGKKEFIVFAIDSTGATGSQDIGTLVNGDSVDFLIENGVTYSIELDKVMIQTLAKAVINGLANTATIVPVDVTAVTTDVIDGLLFIGLDEDPAIAFSDILDVRTHLSIELVNAFRTELPTSIEEVSVSQEASNTGDRVWKMWRDRYGRSIFNAQVDPINGYFIQAPSYFDRTKLYTATMIDFYNYETVLSGSNILDPQRCTILIEAEIDDDTIDVDAVVVLLGTYTYQTINSTLVAQMETILGDWLQSCSPTPTPIASATSSTYFI